MLDHYECSSPDPAGANRHQEIPRPERGLHASALDGHAEGATAPPHGDAGDGSCEERFPESVIASLHQELISREEARC
jgi:hypothetical protein